MGALLWLGMASTWQTIASSAAGLVLGYMSWVSYALYEIGLPSTTRAAGAPPKIMDYGLNRFPGSITLLCISGLLLGVLTQHIQVQTGSVSVYAISASLFFISTQIIISDVRERLVSDLHLLGLFVIAGIAVMTSGSAGYQALGGVIGLLLALGIFALQSLVSCLIKKGHLGIGDVYLGCAFGLLLGPAIAPALMAALIVHVIIQGCIVSGRVDIMAYAQNPLALPLAPAICLSSVSFWAYSQLTTSKHPLILYFYNYY